MKSSGKIIIAIYLVLGAILLRLSVTTAPRKPYKQCSIPIINVTSNAFLAIDRDQHLIFYDIDNKTGSSLFPYPGSHQYYTRSGKDIAKVGNTFYVINPNEHYSALKIDLSASKLQWNEVEWLDEYKNRTYFGHKNSILAVGGNTNFLRKKALSDAVDAYDVVTNKWSRFPSMLEKRLGHTLGEFQNGFCAVGGSASKSVECFDTTTRKWFRLPPMAHSRVHAAVVLFNNELIVTGGVGYREYINYLSLIEMYKVGTSDYDFLKTLARPGLRFVEKFSFVTHSWMTIANLTKPRYCHEAGVFHGNIYVVGGTSQTVEVYNPVTNAWRTMGNRKLDKMPCNAKFIPIQ